LRCRARRALLASGLLLAAASTQGAASDIIQAAKYSEPTTRYAHGVLGDAVEWGTLRLTVGACKGCADAANRTVLIRLPETRVFEDTAPRLADLDSDGAPEVIVVESDLNLGARLAVYDAGGLITATPFIGRAFRWLAPLGAADLDGDGTTEIAYIDRPHLAKTLRVWRYAGRSLSEVASLPGLTNHRIGESHISGGIRDCGNGPEIVTVDAAWRTVMATRLQDDRLSARPLGPFRGAVSLEDAVACK
jgi:hypothetical protein